MGRYPRRRRPAGSSPPHTCRPDSRAACSRTSLGGRTPRLARRVGLAYVPGRRGRAPRGSPVRRRRSRDDRPVAGEGRDLRDRRRPHPGTRGRGRVPDAGQSAPSAAGARRGADGARRPAAPPRAAGGPRGAPVPHVRGGCGPRRAQRAFRPRLPRPRGRAADGPASGGAGGRHGVARSARARGADRARRPRLARLVLRHVGGSVPPRAARRPGDGRDPACARRAGPGARREDGRRPLRAGRAAGAAPGGQAHARRRRAATARRLPLPRRARPGALRRSRPRFEGAPALVLPHRAAATGARGGARRARADRVASARLGARGGTRGAAALRELRPPANARSTRPDRYVYLRRRGDSVVVGTQPTAWGPIRSRRRAELAARALRDADDAELAGLASGASLPRLRRKLARMAADLRFEDAARLRDRISALERVVSEIATLERLRASELCLVVPALERATGARTSSAAGASQRCACCRPGRAHASSWPRASPRRSAQRRRSPRGRRRAPPRRLVHPPPAARARDRAARAGPPPRGLIRAAPACGDMPERDLSLQGLSLGVPKLCRFVHRRLRRARDDGAARRRDTAAQAMAEPQGSVPGYRIFVPIRPQAPAAAPACGVRSRCLSSGSCGPSSKARRRRRP